MLKRMAAATWPLWCGVPVVLVLCTLAFGGARIAVEPHSVMWVSVAVAVAITTVSEWASRTLVS